MKSFIFGKRGKRFGSLVPCYITSAFPVSCRMESGRKPKKKDIELHFLFKDNEQNPAQATKGGGRACHIQTS